MFSSEHSKLMWLPKPVHRKLSRLLVSKQMSPQNIKNEIVIVLKELKTVNMHIKRVNALRHKHFKYDKIFTIIRYDHKNFPWSLISKRLSDLDRAGRQNPTEAAY